MSCHLFNFMSNRDITCLGLAINKTNSHKSWARKISVTFNSSYSQINSVEKWVPKNGLLLYAKLRTTKITVKQFYEDTPKHNFKQQGIVNDCWETIATGRQSWHISNLSRDDSCKGRKLNCKQEPACKHKTSIFPISQKGIQLY